MIAHTRQSRLIDSIIKQDFARYALLIQFTCLLPDDLILFIARAIIGAFDFNNFNSIIIDDIWTELYNDIWIQVDGDLTKIAPHLSTRINKYNSITLIMENQQKMNIIYRHYDDRAVLTHFEPELIASIASNYIAINTRSKELYLRCTIVITL